MNAVHTYLRTIIAIGAVTACAVASAADPMEGGKPQTFAQRTADSFGKTDLNGDGFITREEFADAYHLRGTAPSSDRDIRATRIMSAFQEMDKNADGRVSGEEFGSYMEKNGG